MLTSTGYPDIYVSKLDASGNFAAATHVGKTRGGQGRRHHPGRLRQRLHYGRVHGHDRLRPTAGTYNLISQGGFDVFVLKLTRVSPLRATD